MSIANWKRIELVQSPHNAQEWWVELNGRPVIGFCGESSRQRAEKYFRELTRIVKRVGTWPSETTDDETGGR